LFYTSVITFVSGLRKRREIFAFDLSLALSCEEREKREIVSRRDCLIMERGVFF
jgi:hypothetical protein